ncbi:hypothetical protein C8R45DRAFT_924294 [Mycena sanguinolenta]|nr:hypothetical protein C8R45DRAFT_924294 [Mycena sanguinolenta]
MCGMLDRKEKALSAAEPEARKLFIQLSTKIALRWSLEPRANVDGRQSVDPKQQTDYRDQILKTSEKQVKARRESKRVGVSEHISDLIRTLFLSSSTPPIVIPRFFIAAQTIRQHRVSPLAVSGSDSMAIASSMEEAVQTAKSWKALLVSCRSKRHNEGVSRRARNVHLADGVNTPVVLASTTLNASVQRRVFRPRFRRMLYSVLSAEPSRTILLVFCSDVDREMLKACAAGVLPIRRLASAFADDSTASPSGHARVCATTISTAAYCLTRVPFAAVHTPVPPGPRLACARWLVLLLQHKRYGTDGAEGYEVCEVSTSSASSASRVRRGGRGIPAPCLGSQAPLDPASSLVALRSSLPPQPAPPPTAHRPPHALAESTVSRTASAHRGGGEGRARHRRVNKDADADTDVLRALDSADRMIGEDVARQFASPHGTPRSSLSSSHRCRRTWIIVVFAVLGIESQGSETLTENSRLRLAFSALPSPREQSRSPDEVLCPCKRVGRLFPRRRVYGLSTRVSQDEEVGRRRRWKRSRCLPRWRGGAGGRR